jgi:polysaccharide biosynthesis protein PslJ
VVLSEIGAAERTGRIDLPWRRPAQPLERKDDIDAVKVLGVYVGLLLLVPSNIVLPGLGAAGTPANVWILIALLWYIGSWLIGRISPAPGTRAPRLAMIPFAAAVLLSYVSCARRSPSGPEQLAADRGLIQLTAWIAVVVIASAGIRNYGRFDRLMRLLVRCGSIVAFLGVFEFFTRIDLASYIQIPGLSTSAIPALMNRGDFVRPTSTAVQPLEFGAVTTLLLPFAIQQAFDAGRRGRIRRWVHVTLIAASLPMTVSRTSVIGAAIVLMTLLPTWRPQRRYRALVVVGFGVVLMKVAVPGLIGTLFGLFDSWLNGGDSSTNARTMDYAQLGSYVTERPLTGLGFQTFLPLLYFFTDNMYLLALAETGIIGVAAILLMYLTFLHCGGAGRRRFTEDYQKEIGQAFVAGALVTLVASATFDTLSFPMFSGVFFLLFGCSGAYYGMARQVERARSGRHDE